MWSFPFSFVFFVVAASLLIACARNDWRGMILPNGYSLALVALFFLGVLLPERIFPGVKLLPGLLGGAAVFLPALVLYKFRLLGGGDTKLAGAVSLLIGFAFLNVFVIAMSVTGGLLALHALARNSAGSEPIKLPYGIAIAVGGIIALFCKWLLPFLPSLESFYLPI